jgi:hypothetical protein
VEPRDEGGADPNHGPAHDQRINKAKKQYPVLICGWHLKEPKDQCDNENVIHRKGKLDQVTGRKFSGFLLPPRVEHPKTKNHRQEDADARPEQRVKKFNGFGLAMDDKEIQRNKHQDRRNKNNPPPGGNFNQGQHLQ